MKKVKISGPDKEDFSQLMVKFDNGTLNYSELHRLSYFLQRYDFSDECEDEEFNTKLQAIEEFISDNSRRQPDKYELPCIAIQLSDLSMDQVTQSIKIECRGSSDAEARFSIDFIMERLSKIRELTQRQTEKGR